MECRAAPEDGERIQGSVRSALKRELFTKVERRSQQSEERVGAAQVSADSPRCGAKRLVRLTVTSEFEELAYRHVECFARFLRRHRGQVARRACKRARATVLQTQDTGWTGR